MSITYYTKEGKFEANGRFEIPYYKLHRENGPAITYSDGLAVWCINGKRHRTNGPAVICNNGDKEWWQYGKLHRKNGPACIDSKIGLVGWYINGKRHRLNGPAVEFSNRINIWYVNDKKLNTKKVETWIKSNNINLKTKQHQVLFMVMFG